MLRQQLIHATNVAATFGTSVATLADLTETLARATGLSKATAFAYGRFARESGYVSQHGRGNNAAQMTLRDAVNLLIAVGGTGTTREAGPTIDAFRKLRSFSGYGNQIDGPLFSWLKPLGIVEGRYVKADFGSFLDFLMNETANGGLRDVCRLMPDNPRLRDLLPAKTEIGVNLDVVVEFSRTDPIVSVYFRPRYSNRRTDLHAFTFQGSPLLSLGMEVIAYIPVTTLAALAYCVTSGPLPKQLRTPVQIDRFLFPERA
jgi:hypothetical protein